MQRGDRTRTGAYEAEVTHPLLMDYKDAALADGLTDPVVYAYIPMWHVPYEERLRIWDYYGIEYKI